MDCSVGVGTGNTCTDTMLDAQTHLFGLDIDGDVDGNDKLYSTLHCISAPRAPVPAPCAPGSFVSGKSGDTWQCSPIGEAAITYVKTSCALYTGWQDGCDACTSPPVKWGFANDGGCTNGVGADDTCTSTTQLGGETVEPVRPQLRRRCRRQRQDPRRAALQGAEHHGDRAYSLAPPVANPKCPDGQFVTGHAARRHTPVCADPSAQVAQYVADHCIAVLRLARRLRWLQRSADEVGLGARRRVRERHRRRRHVHRVHARRRDE